jgi:hypothetical protein
MRHRTSTEIASTEMTRSLIEPNATLTERGRTLCERLTEELYANYDTDPYEGWKQLTAIYDFGWSVGSGNRVAGRLPAQIDGKPLVRGPRSYVLKVEFGATIDDNRTDLSNWIEATIWEQATERGAADLFAPVVDHATDYLWLVMEEVETVGYDHPSGTMNSSSSDDEAIRQRQAYEQRVETFEDRLSDAGLGLGLDGEGQIGISPSGNVVALDYEHVTDESAPDQPAWIGSYDTERGQRLTPGERDHSGPRERLRQIASGTNGSVTGYGIRSRIDQWRN